MILLIGNWATDEFEQLWFDVQLYEFFETLQLSLLRRIHNGTNVASNFLRSGMKCLTIMQIKLFFWSKFFSSRFKNDWKFKIQSRCFISFPFLFSNSSIALKFSVKSSTLFSKLKPSKCQIFWQFTIAFYLNVNVSWSRCSTTLCGVV